MELGYCKTNALFLKKTSRQIAYAIGECLCKNGDYHYQEKISRCPCCNSRVRYSTHSNKHGLEN